MPLRAITVALLAVIAAGARAQTTLRVPGEIPTIQAAIGAASTGDTVLVDPGTYVETIDFLGKSITVRATQGPYRTTIDADRQGRAVTFVNGEGRSSILAGFTIINGRAPSGVLGLAESGKHGGGIYCYGASPTILGCIIHSNRAGTGSSANSAPVGSGGSGGGVAAIGIFTPPLVALASPALVNCMIVRNDAGSGGGGVDGIGGDGGYGGGVFLLTSDAEIINCTIADNQAGNASFTGDRGVGGGIYLSARTSGALVINCNVTHNRTGTEPLSIARGTSNIYPSGLTTIQFSNVGGFYAGSTNLNLPSGYIDREGGDYRIHERSPLIDRGTASIPVNPVDDIDGHRRFERGGIDIGADEVPAKAHPGSGDDFELETTVTPGFEVSFDNVKLAKAGDLVVVRVFSRDGTYDGAVAPLLLAQPSVTGQLPPGPPAFPEVHIDQHLPIGFLLGPPTAPLGAPILPPGGITLGFVIPPGLAGTSVMLQSLAPTPSSANGIFATTDGHELRVTM